MKKIYVKMMFEINSHSAAALNVSWHQTFQFLKQTSIKMYILFTFLGIETENKMSGHKAWIMTIWNFHKTKIRWETPRPLYIFPILCQNNCSLDCWHIAIPLLLFELLTGAYKYFFCLRYNNVKQPIVCLTL